MKIHKNWKKDYRRHYTNKIIGDSVVILDDGLEPKWSVNIYEGGKYSHTLERARKLIRAEQIARQFMNRVYDIESKSREAMRIDLERKKSLEFRERLRKISGI